MVRSVVGIFVFGYEDNVLASHHDLGELATALDGFSVERFGRDCRHFDAHGLEQGRAVLRWAEKGDVVVAELEFSSLPHFAAVD